MAEIILSEIEIPADLMEFFEPVDMGKKGDVLTINTQSSGVAHFATMPLELAENCIKAGCPETVCAECGAPYVRVVERETHNTRPGYTSAQDYTKDHFIENGSGGNVNLRYRPITTTTTLGFQPSCTCKGATRPGVVLDPFGGAGTTALAALKHNRHYQLIELNPKYVGIAQKRIRDFDPYQEKVFADGSKQLSLFQAETR